MVSGHKDSPCDIARPDKRPAGYFLAPKLVRIFLFSFGVSFSLSAVDAAVAAAAAAAAAAAVGAFFFLLFLLFFPLGSVADVGVGASEVVPPARSRANDVDMGVAAAGVDAEDVPASIDSACTWSSVSSLFSK